jgi:hypothetical protein
MLMKHYYRSIRCRLLAGVLLVLGPLVLVVMVLGAGRPGIGAGGGAQQCAMPIFAVLFCGGPLAILAGCAGLVVMVLAVADLQNPARHRLLGPLRQYGNPVEVARHIDAEFEANQGVVSIGEQASGATPVALCGLWVTPSWVIEVRGRHVAVARLADLEWVEEARMPTDQNRRALVGYEVGSAGARVVFRITREEAYRLYLALGERCPWILDLETWPGRKRADRPARRGERRGIQTESAEEPSGPDA